MNFGASENFPEYTFWNCRESGLKLNLKVSKKFVPLSFEIFAFWGLISRYKDIFSASWGSSWLVKFSFTIGGFKLQLLKWNHFRIPDEVNYKNYRNHWGYKKKNCFYHITVIFQYFKCILLNLTFLHFGFWVRFTSLILQFISPILMFHIFITNFVSNFFLEKTKNNSIKDPMINLFRSTGHLIFEILIILVLRNFYDHKQFPMGIWLL